MDIYWIYMNFQDAPFPDKDPHPLGFFEVVPESFFGMPISICLRESLWKNICGVKSWKRKCHTRIFICFFCLLHSELQFHPLPFILTEIPMFRRWKSLKDFPLTFFHFIVINFAFTTLQGTTSFMYRYSFTFLSIFALLSNSPFRHRHQ